MQPAGGISNIALDSKKSMSRPNIGTGTDWQAMYFIFVG